MGIRNVGETQAFTIPYCMPVLQYAWVDLAGCGPSEPEMDCGTVLRLDDGKTNVAY